MIVLAEVKVREQHFLPQEGGFDRKLRKIFLMVNFSCFFKTTGLHITVD